MSRTLAVCADDFGLAEPISAAIEHLARRGRVTAIACIVNTPRWRDDARRLGGLPARVELGLHFNLSEGAPLSAALAQHWPRLPRLPKLIIDAHLRRLPLAALRAEFEAQCAAFRAATGRAPAFIDGHQHVQHLPGVRAVVLDGVQAWQPPPALRATGRLPGPGWALKRRLIECTGGRALQRELERRGLRHNALLLGAYDFEARDYRGLMQGWLGQVGADGALLFCHPANAAPGSADPIAAARVRERAYLDSDAFAQDLAAAGVELGRVWR